MTTPRAPSQLLPDVRVVVIVALAAVLLACLSTSQFVRGLGATYLEHGYQMQRHTAILEGQAPNPWQYRVLTAWIAAAILFFCKAINLPHAPIVAFISLRVALDVLLYLFAFRYYRKLGFTHSVAASGVLALAWGVSHSHYDSDLSFNTILDVIFYLAAAVYIRDGKWSRLLPLCAAAALNRETSGLVPFMAGAALLRTRGTRSDWRPSAMVAGSFAVYLAIFVGLRLCYPPQPLFLPYGHRAGWDMFWYNYGRLVTFEQLLTTLSIIPLLALLAFRTWPREVRHFFWAIVPTWVLVHSFAAVMAEARLFLVPQALVFIPGALTLVRSNEL